jgi:hypothetical protein
MAAAVSAFAGSVSAQSPSRSGGTRPEPASIRVSSENVRLNNYLHDLAGPGAIVGVVGGGLLDQVWHKHTSWDDGGNGLAQQLVSRAGQAAVDVSVRHGLAALMHRSTSYQPCDCHGFGPKIEHALLETFTDRRADGSRALSVPRLAGAYAGSFARLAWDSNHNAADVALGTTLSFGFTALFNIARELTGISH